jgi:hypothetical protein
LVELHRLDSLAILQPCGEIRLQVIQEVDRVDMQHRNQADTSPYRKPMDLPGADDE